MTYYEGLLFLHILAAAIWFGAGVLLLLIGARFDRVGDAAGTRSLFTQSKWMATRLFIPMSLAVVVLGILLVIEGAWSFGDLWVVLGLVGFAATFLTGVLLIEPQSGRIAATIEREGMSEAARAGIRRMFALQWIDYTVIALVFAAMALKPTSDDTGTLVAMAVVLVVVVALSLRAAGRDAAARTPQPS
jgi:uncharacterized membrane protein